MKKLLIIPLMAIGLAGCSLFGGTPNAVLAGCEAAAASLKTLAVMRAEGDLNQAQVDRVDEWRPIIDGICGAGNPPEGTAAYDILESGLLALAQVQGGE